MKNGLFTILGVFALLLAATSAANAQTAAGHVFTGATLTFDNPDTTNAAGVNLTASVLDIIADARADWGSVGNAGVDSTFAGRWQIFDRGETFRAVQSRGIGDANDGTTLIVFNNSFGEMQGGDLVRYRFGDPNSAYVFTVRIYDNGADELFAAEEVRPADLDEPAADGEFYLLTTDSDWTTTTVASRGVFGYIAPDCGDGDLSPDGSMCAVETETTETPVSGSPSGGGSSDSSDTAAYILGGAAVVAVAAYFLSDGNWSLFSATPDFGYSITESGYSLNAGGRVDFHKDRWHLYWTAGQQSVNGDFGDFRYSSGGEYKADIWTAAFSESVNGETADYDLSLSANWTVGIWKVSPAFAIDSVYEKGEFQTTNSFRINGEMRYDDWHFSANGNQTQMQLSAVHRF